MNRLVKYNMYRLVGDGNNALIDFDSEYTVSRFIKELELNYKDSGTVNIFNNDELILNIEYQFGEVVEPLDESILDYIIGSGRATIEKSDIVAGSIINYDLYI